MLRCSFHGRGAAVFGLHRSLPCFQTAFGEKDFLFVAAGADVFQLATIDSVDANI